MLTAQSFFGKAESEACLNLVSHVTNNVDFSVCVHRNSIPNIHINIAKTKPKREEARASGSAFPKDLSVKEGATYDVYAIEIKVSEVHPDYIVILVKSLS